MKKILSFIVLLFVLAISSCQEPGTVSKLENYGDEKLPPCVIDGDTIDFYQYFYSGDGYIWVAKSRGALNPSDVDLRYKVGKTEQSVIMINGNMFRRVTGDIICENDSIIVIRRK